MKFLNLVYEGVGGKKGTIDFGNKVHGLTVIQDAVGSDFFKSIIDLALYGAREDFSQFDFPARIEFKFALQDNEYNVMRMFDQTDGVSSELAVITDFAGKKVFAESPQAVSEFVEQAFPKQLFDALFVLDKEKIGEAFIAESQQRETFIEASFAALPAAEQIIARLNDFKAAEKELLAHIESLPQVTKKAISESRQIASARETEAEAIRKDLEEIVKDIAKAAAYETDTADYYDAAAYSEKLSALKEEVDAMITMVANSRTVSDIKAVFTEYKEVEAAAKQEKALLAIKEEELNAVNTKITEGEASIKAFEDKFILLNEKKELLEKSMRELVSLSADSPQSFKIASRIDSYYSKIEEEKALLLDRLAEGEALVSELSGEVELLTARKSELNNTAEYKRDVQNAAIYERDLKYLDKEIKEADAAYDALDKKRAKLYAKNIEISSKSVELKQEQKNLIKSILSGKESIQEAVNADVLYKQTIYGKHLIVSANEVELDAVEKKIASVQQAAAKYSTSLQESRSRKKEVEEHLNKLNERLTLLLDKRSDYEGYNKMNDIVEELEYGSRCPVCDGFVTLKKEMPQKSTKAIDAQIEAVKAEVAKSEAALIEVIGTIGQYDSAARVGNQYLESLAKTADAKRAIINDILVQYNAKDVAELFAMVRTAAEDSNNLTLSIDRYRENEAKLLALTQTEELVVAELNELTEKLIPAQNEKLKQLIDEAARRGAEYETVQHVLNDEKAEELLVKLQVVEDEIEKTDELLAQKESDLNNLISELEDLRRDIMLLEARAVTVDVDGKPLSYQNIIVRAVLADLKSIIKEIDKAEEDKEVAKTRLAALRRVLAKAKDKKAALETETAALRAKLDSAQKVAGAIFAEYEERFNALGITSESDIDALTLSEETISDYQKRIDSYQTESVKLSDKLERLNTALAEGQPYYEALDGLRDTLSALKNDERDAIIRLGDAQKDRDQKIYLYNERIEANVRLSNLQKRIKGIEELSSVIKDGKADNAAFASAVADRASSRIKNWSQDKYYLVIKDGRAALINDRNGRAVKPEKYTKEERMFVLTGIASVYNEALAKLFGIEFAPAAVIKADESDKNSLAALTEIAKDREFIALPEDENAFFRNISKL